jgi:hypothetical protein
MMVGRGVTRSVGRRAAACCGAIRVRLAACFAGCRGQSTVEVVGLLPILLAAGLGAYSLFSAGAAEHAADGAAEAGAVAILQGRDGRSAARAALDGWPARRTHVTVRGRRVTVSVTPSGPLGARLRAEASADAGPAGP